MIERGEIWLVRLDPTVGSELNKTRPVIVVSRADFNEIASTIMIVPVTSSGRFFPGIHVKISSLKEGSHSNITQTRVASKDRFIKKIGQVSPQELKDIGHQLSFYLELIYL